MSQTFLKANMQSRARKIPPKRKNKIWKINRKYEYTSPRTLATDDGKIPTPAHNCPRPRRYTPHTTHNRLSFQLAELPQRGGSPTSSKSASTGGRPMPAMNYIFLVTITDVTHHTPHTCCLFFCRNALQEGRSLYTVPKIVHLGGHQKYKCDTAKLRIDELGHARLHACFRNASTIPVCFFHDEGVKILCGSRLSRRSDDNSVPWEVKCNTSVFFYYSHNSPKY